MAGRPKGAPNKKPSFSLKFENEKELEAFTSIAASRKLEPSEFARLLVLTEMYTNKSNYELLQEVINND